MRNIARWQPIVFHDNSTRVSGRWHTGKVQLERSKAESEGLKELARCKKILGGTPHLEIRLVTVTF
jgi:hypothetical protein